VRFTDAILGFAVVAICGDLLHFLECAIAWTRRSGPKERGEGEREDQPEHTPNAMLCVVVCGLLGKESAEPVRFFFCLVLGLVVGDAETQNSVASTECRHHSGGE
jgi:hypothetical protein